MLFRAVACIHRHPVERNALKAIMSKSESTSAITEGRAKIVLPKGVFYNPVQEFNRDLTIAVICAFQKLHERQWNKKGENIKMKAEKAGKDVILEDYPGIRILEALAASGLRSTRFALEVPHVQEIIANDMDPKAAELIAVNAESNGADSSRLIKASCKDANFVMMENRCNNTFFDVIDLDPYGTAAKFISCAMMSVGHGGLLCITCTDAAVLCGSAAGTSFGRYGGMSLRCVASHELALRILLQSLQHHASVEGRYIQPLISLSADFYVRVFVRVFRGPGEAKLAPCRSSMLYVCNGCGSQFLQPLGRSEVRPGGNVTVVPARGPPVGPVCSECGGHFSIAGPMWSDKIHNVEFIKQMLSELRRSDSHQTTKDSSEGAKKETEDRQGEEKEASDFLGIFANASLKTKDRIVGVLSLAAEELPDCPLYYRADQLAKVVHCHVPSMIKWRSAILNAGYQVSSSHVDPLAFKTDAPPDVIWDIIRAWVKEIPIAEHHLEDANSVIARILGKESKIKVSFGDHEMANPTSRKEGLLRFQPNPEKYWGPKARATRAVPDGDEETLAEKRSRLQGKRKRTGDDMEVGDNSDSP